MAFGDDMASPDVDTLLVQQFGTTQMNVAPTKFNAGPLSVEFHEGALRYIRFQDVEILRAVSFLVRDENWGTFHNQLSQLNIQQDQHSFTVCFEGHCGAHGDDMHFFAKVTGNATGTLDFEVEAHINQDINTNRAGFVVLHPLEVSGLPVTLETVDGDLQDATFPTLINPLQPFMAIRALTTQHHAGLSAEVRMEGDTFEMEDQRNWSDASFKTYVRPLALPWPYTLKKKAVLRQAVRIKTITSAHAKPQRPQPASAMNHVTLGTATEHQSPALGIGIRAEHLSTSLARISALRQLKPAYFIAHLDCRHDAIELAMNGFAHISAHSGVPYCLELVLRNDTDDAAIHTQLSEVARYMTQTPLSLQISPAADLKAVLPGSVWPSCPSFEAISAAAKKYFSSIPIGGGTFAYFTELNRKRPPNGLFDYITFTTCPLVHAADDFSVMETLSTLPYIARSVQALYPNQAIHIGPSTIAARDNPYGSTTFANQEHEAATRICLTDNDPRQRGWFASAWNLGYFSQFARQGMTHIGLSELTGPRGLFNQSQPTPLFYLLATLAQTQGQQQVATLHDSHALSTYATQSDATCTLWIANTTALHQDVQVDAPHHYQQGMLVRWHFLDDRQMTKSEIPLLSQRLNLGPYETIQIIFRRSDR
jgi:hypothetical protein